MTKPDTPQLDRMLAVHEHSQAIGEFLDWLAQQGWRRCRWEAQQEDRLCEGPGHYLPHEVAGVLELRDELDGVTPTERRFSWREDPDCASCDGAGVRTWYISEDWVPDHRTIEQVLADYYDVDLLEMERERMAVLEFVREQNR